VEVVEVEAVEYWLVLQWVLLLVAELMGCCDCCCYCWYCSMLHLGVWYGRTFWYNMCIWLII